MKFTTNSILFYLTSLSTDHSAAFAPPPSRHHIQHSTTTTTVLLNNNNNVPDNNVPDDPKERKRDKVRSLLTKTANRAASVLHKNPIANAIKDTALEGGGLASEKLIQVLNRIEGTLDTVESEVNSLRGELRSVRDVIMLRTSLSGDDDGGGAVKEEASMDSISAEMMEIIETATTDNDASSVVLLPSQTINDASKEDTITPATTEMDIETDTETIATTSPQTSTIDLSTLKYQDIDYTLTEMTPRFIGEDECLVPGEPVVRVEKAPQNSRRIFAGIDIPVSVEDVWEVRRVCFSILIRKFGWEIFIFGIHLTTPSLCTAINQLRQSSKSSTQSGSE